VGQHFDAAPVSLLLSWAPRMDAWKELEQIVASIHRSVDPDARVTHNERIRGRSGERRQLDVTIRKSVGTEEVLVVVECKVYNRPVDIKAVEQFIGMLQDVSAARGVMVSSSGYTKGARSKAAEYGITLLSYEDAADYDWSGLLGKESRLYFVVTTVEAITVVTYVSDDDDEEPIEELARLKTTGGVDLGLFSEIMAPLKQLIYKSREFPLGEYECLIDLGDSLLMETSSGAQPIESIKLLVKKSARRYLTRPEVQSGHILRDAHGEVRYQDIAHKIEWAKIVGEQPGIPLTPDEYANGRDSASPDLPFHVEMSDKDGVLSVRLYDKQFQKGRR
jgi:hypothetical protein